MRVYLSGKQILGFVLLMLFLSGALYLHFFPPNVPKVSGAFIPYDHLATEETDPYLLNGKPPTNEKTIWAVRRYATVQDCLLRSERDADKPDLRKIAWHNMRNRNVANVCLFRIFSSLQTPAAVEKWFESQGLDTRYPGHNKLGESFMIIGKNDLNRSRFLMVGAGYVQRRFAIWIAYAELIQATWSKHGKLQAVSYSLNTL